MHAYTYIDRYVYIYKYRRRDDGWIGPILPFRHRTARARTERSLCMYIDIYLYIYICIYMYIFTDGL